MVRFDLDGDPGPPIDPRDQHILIAYLFPALGDSLLLAPVVNALIDRGAKVDLLLRESAARIWGHIDLDVRIHTVAEDELDRPRDLGRYDVAVDLTRRFDADARPWIADSAPIRLGWIGEAEPNPPLGLTFGTPDFRIASERHWTRYQVLPLRCFGVTEPNYSFQWNVPSTTTVSGARPHLVVVPGSRETKKLFKPKAYGHAARIVGARTTVVGAPNEQAMLADVAALCGGEVYAERDLGGLIALIQNADVVLTNDTGPMHIAFLSHVPTVAVFTRMLPLVWGPPTKDGKNIVIKVTDAMNAYSDEECGDALANAVEHLLSAISPA